MAKLAPPNSFRKKSSHNAPKKALLKRRANAEAGFAKRQDLKDKKRREDIQDVYEYVPEKTRRSKVRLDLDKSEALEFGNLDGIEDAEREVLRARLIGENEDDEKVESDDDEEVDSDAAFEESDEERFAEFFSKKKEMGSARKERSVHFADVDLNEDEEQVERQEVEQESEEDEEEEGEDDEFIDLLDVLDGKGDIDMGSADEMANKLAISEPSGDKGTDFGSDDDNPDMDDEDEETSSEEDTGEDTNHIQITASDDEDLSEGALDNLQNFVSNLDTAVKKRKAPEDYEDAPQVRKRRTIREKNEAGVEDEFRIDSSNSKLNLEDLLAPLATNSASLLTLKKSTKILGSSRTKALSAPLPHRAQERLDREAAYEQTKEEVDKWSGAMKKIREAEHLSFPLQAEKPGRVSNMELAAKFKPTTGLETAVDALLKNAKMRDEDIYEMEEGMLKANNLTVEEVAARRAELRKMRDLMFRAEIKAKRVKKIKSKTYRKIRRKDKERLAGQIDGEEDSDDEEVVMKRELERAKERATLRHKHTGKWARQMKSKHLDEDQRKDLEEMLSKGERLRKKIQGLGSDESEEEESSDDDDLEPEEATENIKRSAFEELQQLKEGGDAMADPGSKKGKGIFEMKFMKDAMARREAEANRQVDDFIQELGAGEGDGGSEDEQNDEIERDPSSGVVVHRAGGRVVYRPGAVPTKPSLHIPSVVPAPSDTSSVTLRSSDLYSSPPASPALGWAAPTADVNPWLAQSQPDVSLKISRKNEVVMSKESKSAEKSKNKLRKDMSKRDEEREKAREDATLEISTDKVLTLGEPTSVKRPQPTAKSLGKRPEVRAKKGVAADSGDDDDGDSDANSEVDAQEAALLAKSKGKGKAGPSAFQQRDLVALAFAGDNVVKEFEEAKQREIAEDAPKEVDTTIAGWGAWGGVGLRKKPPKPERIKKIAGIDPTTRADYNKKHIIISEKRDKKASKYLVKDLPYPYSSQAQFERAMERPLGVQWNTRTAFQRATLPRVVKKPGVVITPLEKLT